MSRDKYDIFVCGGSPHFDMLRRLLPRLRPHGFVHVASTFMTAAEEAAVEPLCDALHRPRYSDAPGRGKEAYAMFNLFCTREINRLAVRPYFIKMDADAELATGWVRYVNEGFAAHPDVAMFGNRRGLSLDLHLSGPPVRARLGRDIHTSNAVKVCGPFYACRTNFFKLHDGLMQGIHELCWCFKRGIRRHPSPLGLPDTTGLVQRSGILNPNAEDGTRCAAAHAAGGEVLAIPSGGLVGQERI